MAAEDPEVTWKSRTNGVDHITLNKVFVSPAPRFLLLDGAAT